LDNINERGYQPAFLQMLVGEGHRVVHSTRHMAIEFGKDVVSVDSNGVPCAFQLKGDPGSRLTLAKFREMRPQLTELVEQPIRYPGINPDDPHHSYLVTNGEIEEEVQRAVDDMNVGYNQRGLGRLLLIGRGTLLKWAIDHASTFWSAGFSIHEKLIRFYNSDGVGAPMYDALSEGLDEILCLSDQTASLSGAEFGRRLVSASIFATLTTRNYALASNHVAIAGVQAVLFAHLAASETRHGRSNTEEGRAAKSIAREAFFGACTDLADEVVGKLEAHDAARPDLVERDHNVIFLSDGAFASHFTWRARELRTLSLLSITRLQGRQGQNSWPLSESIATRIDAFLEERSHPIDLWGEAAVPQALAYFWRCRTRVTNRSLQQVISFIISRNRPEDGYFPDPYHLADAALRDRLADGLGIERGKVKEDTQGNASYLTLGLFHCFVRANLKSAAKQLWPGLTRMSHLAMVPTEPWAFGLWRTDFGENVNLLLKPTGQWRNIQKDAADIETPHVPRGLSDDPIMLFAYITFAPHRALPEVLRFLHYEVCGTWFLPDPRPRSVNVNA